jgi:sucrose-6-phosphate hydrolase SacC (GH32 family)
VVDTHNLSGFGDGQQPALVAIYTACLRRPEGGQMQELAYSTDRGRHWTRYAGNPVLDLGERDFRDPKVFWHAPTERWVMVVVLPHERCALFYASTNLKDWQALSRFEAPFEGQGIWECPDLIPLQAPNGESVWMFKVDVFGGHPSGDTGARIFFGQFDGTRFVPEGPADAPPQWADHGADFYAALSWAHLPSAADGGPAHPVWLAWLNCHRYAKHLPTAPWRGQMTVPRTLQARRGPRGGWQLLQQPWPGLQALRGELLEGPDIALVDSGYSATGPSAAWRQVEMELTLEMGGANEAGLCVLFGDEGCALAFDADTSQRLRLGYDATRQAVFVDRSRSGFVPQGDVLYAQRRWAEGTALAAGQALRLRVLIDRCSVEVFVGDGEAVLTEQLLPQGDGAQLGVYALDGGARFSGLRAWPLASAAFVQAQNAGWAAGPVDPQG